jgi:hypothetical protein
MRRMRGIVGALTTIAIASVLNVMLSCPALAWGDEGHEIIALIAQAHLDAAAQKKVGALLGADTDSLTGHDIAAEATWADKLRNANDHGERQNTSQWHFVDIEIGAPDIDRACFGHPVIPAGMPASRGPARDCIVDKIQEFSAELANPATDAEEQIVALKFLLHFVGDLHQPLHASDDHDRGGNGKRVSAVGFRAANLHRYWDTEFVRRLGPNARHIANDLNGHISEQEVQTWSQGGAAAWAMETFKVGRDDVYGQLPLPGGRGGYRLPEQYIALATQDVAIQLSKAGIRLAFVLNRALGAPD